ARSRCGRRPRAARRRRATRCPSRSIPLARTETYAPRAPDGPCRHYGARGTFAVRCTARRRRGALMMLTERIWSGNSLRNFHYLIACSETGEALAVDPLEWRLCLEAARRHGWQITQILNTHEHAGHNGGNPERLYETFAAQLARLPDETRVYPGHEYLARNLEFTLDREPGNEDAARWLEEARRHDPAAARVTTLGEEKRINTFFRLQNPKVIARLREAFPEIGERPDARTVFLKLRELRNRW